MTLNDFGRLLKSVVPETYRYAAHKAPFPHIVWHEYRRVDRHADNAPGYMCWRVQADYYTKKDDDAGPGIIEETLTENGIAFKRRVLYEPDARLVRHIFDCEVIVDGAI